MTDPRTLADRFDRRVDYLTDHGRSWPYPAESADDLAAAAVALRHHANLTHENERLRELCGFLIDACATHRIDVPIHSSLLDLAADIAGGAAAVSPPAPTTCPTCRSDDPMVGP